MGILALILTILLVIALYVIWNLNRKIVKQEELIQRQIDIVESQVDYLRKVSYLIQESKLYIDKLDERGIFRADDEVGTFFNFMKEIQDNINQFRLPDDYGKTKS
jgi:DNA helicase HerA-like ATPase